MVSLAPSIIMFGALTYSLVLTGNDDLVKRLLTNSRCVVRLGHTVNRVKPCESGSGFSVDVNGTIEHFDAVIIATPIERSGHLETFPNIPVREFTQVYVTVVTAQGLNASYFGMSSLSSDSFVIAPSNSSAESQVHLIWNNNHTASGDSVYLLHSKQELPQHAIDSMFVAPKSPVSRHHWEAAYPVESPTTQAVLPPVVVTDGLYYVNSIETIASSMETSALSARNAARLLMKWWTRK